MKYINLNGYQPGEVHKLLAIEPRSTRDVNRISTKLRFLCGAYTLQSNRVVYNFIMNMIESINHMSGLGKSDHLQVKFIFNCCTEMIQTLVTKLFYFAGNTGLSGELARLNWLQEFNGRDLSTSWENLTEKLSILTEPHTPVSKVSSGSFKKSPFMTQSCHEAIRKRHTKWEKYLHCKTNQNYEIYKESRIIVKAEMRRSKYEYEKDLTTKIKTDSKLFWSYVRSRQKM